ncbi:CoA ester lyase [Georgenia yuyongxinii]|uniref:CoA ester lyase n=1 Tax=Georgenia yuyongxinii TaxID=2589797 RepID=A0A5B8BZU4_9MICO|nr:CoA ester lyase [Georgenia yuyongxinii]QDC23783.1 CoA ester lyase [Georgenia yuyongxinii]
MSAANRSRGLHAWLFVPADDERKVSRMGTRGANVVILDLEDAVPEGRKAAARRLAAEAIAGRTGGGPALAVRINATDMAEADLDATVAEGLDFVIWPHCESGAALVELDEQLTRLERSRGLPPRAVGVVALIESPRGVLELTEIAEAPRVVGLALGSEDLALELGVAATRQSLDLPVRQLALVAAAAGHMGIGLDTSLGNYVDLDALTASAKRSRDAGLTGALCIHPRQVGVINAVFGEGDIEWARAVIAAWDANGRQGVTSADGRMVDRPVAERAAAILAAAAAVGPDAALVASRDGGVS